MKDNPNDSELREQIEDFFSTEVFISPQYREKAVNILMATFATQRNNLLAELLAEAKKEAKAAKKNLEYQKNVTKNERLVKNWEGIIFGIDQVTALIRKRMVS